MFDKFKIRVIIAVWEYHIAMYIANAMEKDMMKDIHLDFIKGS